MGSQPRQYGSMDSRSGQQWGQEDIHRRPSVCWPFMWWCKNEPLADEESLLGRRWPGYVTRQRSLLRQKEESDDELLQDHQMEQSSENERGKHKQTELELEIDLLKQKVGHLENQLDREVKQRQEEKQFHEENIKHYKKTQEEARKLQDVLHLKLEKETLQRTHLEEQIKLMSLENEQRLADEFEKYTDECKRRTELEQKLEQEKRLRREEREHYEESVTKHEEVQKELRRHQEELRGKLELESLQKSILQQQVQHVKVQKQNHPAEEEIDKLNKEFKRRKQLEEELEKEVQKQKKLSETLQKETLQRQQLEQNLRLAELDKEAERMEREEQNQEQEIQRRQLQHAVEQEFQKRQELSQQLENEIKLRQELQRKLLKETQERHQVELELQEEIQIRHELEVEFKQADLQSQNLEQELRQQLREMQRLLSTEEEEVEVITVHDDEINSNEYSDSVSTIDASNEEEDDNILDDAEEKHEEDDNESKDTVEDADDDEEKQEIRRLLLEEFQRLPTEAKEEQLEIIRPEDSNVEISTDNDNETVKQNGGFGLTDHIDESFVQQVEEECAVNKINSTEVTNEHINTIPQNGVVRFASRRMDLHQGKKNDVEENTGGVTSYKSVCDLNEQQEYSDIVLRRENVDLTPGLEEDEHENAIGQRRKGIILKKGWPLEIQNVVPTPSSEEDEHVNVIGQRRKGIILKKGLSLELENILEEYDTTDLAGFVDNEIVDSKNYSTILERTINFQGRDITLSTLIGEKVLPEMEMLLGKLANALNKEKQLVIASPCTRKIRHYVSRTLERKVYIRKEIFKHRTSRLPPVFAVSGITKYELQEIVPSGENIIQLDENSEIEKTGGRFILLNDLTAGRDYEEICKKARNFKTIHWLSKQPEGFIWKKSKGNIGVIRCYIDRDKNEDINSPIDVEDKIVVLTANDGEGKSTYLSNLEMEFQEAYPGTWVIRVNADEHVTRMKKYNFSRTDVIDILSHSANLTTSDNSELEIELLRYSLMVKGNVVVLVDEVNFKERDKFRDFLIILNTMKIKKLVVAVESCMGEFIESIFSTLSFALKPLNKEELSSLLMQLWGMDFDSKNIKCFQEFSTALFLLADKSFVNENSLNPFCAKMLAQNFKKEFDVYCESKIINLPKSLDVFQLYERFSKSEYVTYSNTNEDVHNREHILADLMKSALLSIFPETIIKELFEERTSCLEENRKTRGTKFPFLNRNLEKYLSARWFAENYQSHKSIIQNTYFEGQYQSMWAMFDQILCHGYELHAAVLNKDVRRVKDLIFNGIDINSVDLGGRTALHIAALRGKYLLESESRDMKNVIPIVSLLIEHKADVSIRDDILNWAPLQYADRNESWVIIDEFLKGHVDINDMTCTREKLGNRMFLQETLTNAAVEGLTHVTAYILDTGIDINMPLHSTKYSHQQYGVLHIASEHGHTPLLEFLLEHNAEVNLRIWDRSTSLHLACKHNKKESVELLLKNGANIDYKNKQENTALHEAIRSDNSDIMQMLLDRMADVNVSNIYGDTPLHVACQMNNLTAVSHLLDRNADINIRNKNGDNPLECAVRKGYTALVKYILDNAEINVVNQWKEAKDNFLHVAAISGNVLMLDYLLQVMKEVNIGTVGGDTPLHLASLHGKTDTVSFLIKKNADVNRTNIYGNAPLHLASLRDNISTLNILLENNAQVNIGNVEGNTPLHLASLQGAKQAVRCLIKNRADVSIQNREKNTPLLLAAQKDNTEVIKILIEAGSDVNIPDRYGSSILHQASARGKLELVKLLTETGRCYLDIRNARGDTPLLLASKSNHAAVVECLRQGGADINFLASDGNSPLHIAAASGNIELARKLIELGAELNMPNSQGFTPLHRAIYAGSEAMVRCLVEHGADVTIQNRMGETPFEVAVQLGSADAILDIL